MKYDKEGIDVVFNFFFVVMLEECLIFVFFLKLWEFDVDIDKFGLLLYWNNLLNGFVFVVRLK